MSKASISTTVEGVRRLAVSKQHLAGKLSARPTGESILSVIRDTCYVQWGAPSDKEIGARIGETMREFAGFLGAKEVEYSGRVPEIWKSSLR